jgi:hypothetical protein
VSLNQADKGAEVGSHGDLPWEVANVLRRVPDNASVKMIANRLLAGQPIEYEDVMRLNSILSLHSSWKSNVACLACWCLQHTSSESPGYQIALSSLRNIAARAGAEGDGSRRTVVKVCRAAAGFAGTVSACLSFPYFLWLTDQGSELQGAFWQSIVFFIVVLVIGTILATCAFLPFLRPLSTMVDSPIRREAARGLGKLGTPQDLELLAKLASSSDRGLQLVCEEALMMVLKRTGEANSHEASKDAVQELSRVYARGGFDLDMEIIRVIGLIGYEDILPWLLRTQEQANLDEKKAAIGLAIAQIEDRARQAKEQATLLRPAEERDDTLLRPATYQVVPDELLVRPVE